MNLSEKQINIVDYLTAIGEPIIQADRRGVYYSHRDHDSLKINAIKNNFYWNSRQLGGGIPQYLMAMFDLTIREAYKKIESDSVSLHIIPTPLKKKNYPKHFTYRVSENPISIESKRYLVAKRKLPNQLVQHLMDNELIAEDERKQIIFKWYRQGKVVGFSKKGTQKLTEEEKIKYNYNRDYMIYIAPTTEENTFWGFNNLIGLPENLFFFEAEIDLLSYQTLHERELNNAWLICLHGLKIDTVMAFLKEAITMLQSHDKTVQSIALCFDNDTAGINTFNTLTKELSTDNLSKKDFFKELTQFQINGKDIINHIPEKPSESICSWDWSDELIHRKNRK